MFLSYMMSLRKELGFGKPDVHYKFPKCPQNNRSFQYTCLSRFSWLTYSSIENGAFCKYCILFASENAGISENLRLKSLITEPFTKYQKAIEAFRSEERRVGKEC